MFTANKMAKVFFTNSGSESNDTQVKLVWYYNDALGRPDKKKFIARTKLQSYSYTPALFSVFLFSSCLYFVVFLLPYMIFFMHFTFKQIPWIHFHCRRSLWVIFLSIHVFLHYIRNLICHLHLFCTLTALIIGVIIYQVRRKRSIRPGSCFHCRTVMGAGGVIPPPATYFDKALSSGYVPIGAVLISPEISDVIYSQSNKIGAFIHGFTYSGHPLACAVALEALKIYKERNIVELVNKISPKFQEGLKAFSDSPIIGETRGTGLVLSTEFVDNKSPDDPFPPEWGVGTYFGAQCQKFGVLVSYIGNYINMAPPFTLTLEELDELISVYGKAPKETEKSGRTQGPKEGKADGKCLKTKNKNNRGINFKSN